MSVKDKNVAKDSALALKPIQFALGTSAVSQTAKKTDAVTIGFAFEVVRVEAYALTVTASITVDVHIGATSVLSAAITPVADTPTAGVLSTTLASRRGTSTDILSLKYTTNGAGAATNVFVTVWVRPRPLNGEV